MQRPMANRAPYDGLILLPGMMCDERLFAPQVDLFSKSIATEVADLSRGTSIEEMADIVIRDTRFERFALAGLSMGGIVAMEMVRRASDRVERLALLDTNHLADDADRITQRKRQIARVRAGELRALMVEELKPFYVAPVHMGDPALNTIFMGMAEDLGPDVFERQARALIARQSAEDVLSAYAGKTLVLCGEHDKPCPPQRHDAMHALLPNSHRVAIANAGHISTLENPHAVNDALAHWLDIEI